MSLAELFKTVNGVPGWFNIIIWSALLLILYFLRYFWKKVGYKAFNQWVDKVNKIDAEDKKLLLALKNNEINQDNWSLKQIRDKVYRKGYRNEIDEYQATLIRDSYKDIGGNHDGDVIYSDIMAMPYKTELKIPEEAGTYLPSKEAIKIMSEFYRGVRDKRIPEHDISPVHNITTESNKKEKKRNG